MMASKKCILKQDDMPFVLLLCCHGILQYGAADLQGGFAIIRRFLLGCVRRPVWQTVSIGAGLYFTLHPGQ